ncbi:MAG: ATP-binding protein [Chloroflexaceae bacterium]|nr:ATP-binding protein [Chloroflexaceae bacterium]
MTANTPQLHALWEHYLAHTSHVVVLTLDEAGRILNANTAFRRLLNLADEPSLVGRLLSDFLVSDSKALWYRSWPTAGPAALRLHFAHGDQMPQTLECQLFPDNGPEMGDTSFALGDRRTQEQETSSSLGVQRSTLAAGGWLVGEADVRELVEVQHGFIRLMNDLTTLTHERARQAFELEQTRAALAQRNEELHAFAHIVSHDLQAPLRTFRVFTRRLQERYGDELDGEGRRALSLLGSAAERVQRQVAHLLKLAEAGRVAEPQPNLDLNRLFAELTNDLSGLLLERQAQLHVEAQLPTVWGDRQRLGEVFQNLIVNGLTYNESPRPTVYVSLRQLTMNNITLAIRDNGVGIAPADQSRVWQPFQRSATSARFAEGQGLGLAFCRRVVQAHGGQLELESAPGQGTTMLVILPRLAPTQPDQPAKPAPYRALEERL